MLVQRTWTVEAYKYKWGPGLAGKQDPEEPPKGQRKQELSKCLANAKRSSLCKGLAKA